MFRALWRGQKAKVVASTILHARIQPVMRPNLYQLSADIDSPWYPPPLAAKKGAILKASLFLKVSIIVTFKKSYFQTGLVTFLKEFREERDQTRPCFFFFFINLKPLKG